MTFFIFSSNSPRYFVSASKRPICKLTTRFSFKLSGTSPLAIIIARPSAMAVFPTPGSPTKHGFDLRRRTKIRITRVTSSSRPSTGSNLPSRASAVKSIEQSANVCFFVFRVFLPAPTSSRSFAPVISFLSTFKSHPSSAAIVARAPLAGSSIIASASSLLPTSLPLALARSKTFFNSSLSASTPSALGLLNGFISSSSLTPARSPSARRVASSVTPCLCNALLVRSRFRVSASRTCSEPHSALRNFFARSIASLTATTASPSNVSKNPHRVTFRGLDAFATPRALVFARDRRSASANDPPRDRRAARASSAALRIAPRVVL